jgi:hypothetical protein
MSELEEVVQLPDPAVQPLVHPIDLAETRGDYRFAWLVGVLSGPAVGLAVGVMAWRLGAGYVIPVVAGLSLVAIGAWARRARLEEAWAYIPRRRQDRARVLPRVWDLADGIVSAVGIVIAALLAAPALVTPDIPAGVREFVLGAAAAVAVLVALDLVASITVRRGSFVDRPWYASPIVVGVAIAALIGAGVLATPGTSLLTRDAGLGAAMILAVGAALGLWGLRTPRRAVGGELGREEA